MMAADVKKSAQQAIVPPHYNDGFTRDICGDKLAWFFHLLDSANHLPGFAEDLGRQSQDPRRVQTVPRNQAMTVAAVQLEYVDEAVVRAGLVVMLLFVLLCKSDIELPIDNANTKRRVARRQVGITEGVHQVEAGIIHLDGVVMEIGGVKKIG